MSRIPGVIKESRINQGDGYLLIGTANTAHDVKDLQDSGAIAGPASWQLGRNTNFFEGGYPAMEVVGRYSKRQTRLTVVLYEWSLSGLKWKLGLGQSTASLGGGTQTVTKEKKKLSGNNWFHLSGVDLTNGTVVVKSTDATPVTFVENTDYEIHYARGLIRRKSGTAIADGSTPEIDFSWTRPASTTFAGGFDSPVPDYYPLRYVVPIRKNRRKIVDFYKAIPIEDSAQEYSAEGWHMLKLTFACLPDLTKDPDVCVWNITHEE